MDALREPHVGALLTVSGLRTFVRGIWIAIAVIASIRLLHAGSAGVGWLMLAAGVGALIAVPLSGGLIQRTRLGVPAALGLIGCGVPLVLIAAVPRIDVALALVAAWGIGMAVADVATLSLLYRVLDIPLLPRVTTLIESSKLALEGLGGLLAPGLVVWFGIRGALITAGLPLPIVVIVGWRMLRTLDASAGERTNVLTLLHGVPCLQPLDMASLGLLATAVQTVRVPIGTDVVRQGDPGDGFYVVKAGSADVLVDGYAVGRVEQAGSFGERALLRDAPRTATVRSTEPMELLTLSREDFLSGLTGQPIAGLTMLDGGTPPDGTALSDRDRAEVLGRLNLFIWTPQSCAHWARRPRSSGGWRARRSSRRETRVTPSTCCSKDWRRSRSTAGRWVRCTRATSSARSPCCTGCRGRRPSSPHVRSPPWRCGARTSRRRCGPGCCSVSPTPPGSAGATRRSDQGMMALCA